MHESNTAALREKLRTSTRQFQPRVRRVWERYAPDTYWHGKLFLRTHQSLADTEIQSITAAVSLELFRTYGLTRESPFFGDFSETSDVQSETLLAGDQFLSTSFDLITQEHDDPKQVGKAVKMAADATQVVTSQLTDQRNVDTEGDRFVTAVVTGQLAVELAGILSNTSPVITNQLAPIGTAFGMMIADQRRLAEDARVTQGENDLPRFTDADPSMRLTDSQTMNVDEEIESVLGSSDSPLMGFFNRLKENAEHSTGHPTRDHSV